MRKEGENQELDNLIEERLRRSFGYSDEDNIAIFDEAAAEPDDPELTPPDGEFEKIMSAVHRQENKPKVFRFKRVTKAMVLVAVIVCMVLGAAIGAVGKKAYEYSSRERENGSVVWNNDMSNMPVGMELTQIYEDISNNLKISVLELVYIPETMNLSKVSFVQGYARMEFTYNNKYLYFIQSEKAIERSVNTGSDRYSSESVMNKRLDMELTIKRHQISGGSKEYSTEFTIDNAYYYLEGVMEEKEFKKIIEKIGYYKKISEEER